MSVKYTLLLLLLLGSTSLLLAQDSKSILILPFDNETFKERIKEYNLFENDSVKQKNEVFVLENMNKYSMKWFKVYEDEMAQMPQMPIKKDIQYTIRIKKYESQYPDAIQKKVSPLLKDEKLSESMEKPE